MIGTRNIETAPGLVFDASVAGREDAPLVLLLHGFCVSRHYWDNQLPALARGRVFRGGAKPARLRSRTRAPTRPISTITASTG